MTTSTTARASIGIPTARADQIRSLAKAQGITTTALIERWINRAIAEGEPGAIELPGFWAMRDDDIIIAQIAGHALPWMKPRQALLLATVLDSAAGTPDPKGDFSLPTGRAVEVGLGPVKLKIGRTGNGVVFIMTRENGDVEKFAAPASFITDTARMIRNAIDNA